MVLGQGFGGIWLSSVRFVPKSSPKKRIQTAEYAEYAEKWNTSACFAYSAVLSPFYFGDVFESSAFAPSCQGQPPLSEDSGPARKLVSWFRHQYRDPADGGSSLPNQPDTP